MNIKTSNVRIASIDETLETPQALIDAQPASQQVQQFVLESRATIERIIKGEDPRLLAIVGPCSIHDTDAALDYARRLKKYIDSGAVPGLYVVMRVYFEKPRTTIGWKGLINDPNLNQSFEIEKGLALARSLLLELNTMAIPCGTEYLDLITPQYFNDLIAWGAIGARTTESQCHRQLASGLSCPVGFKNGTDGNVQIAVDAMVSAKHPHHFLAVTADGKLAQFKTTGNSATHIILRGGKSTNYDSESVASACLQLEKQGLIGRVMVDCSHANSNKDYRQQPHVAADIAAQLSQKRIFGVMIESNIHAGNQKLGDKKDLQYGVSITDGCIDWQTTEEVLSALSQAARQ